ncbi:MAG: ATP-binding cassette domain-containing protein [Halobacteriota archaeon]|jgi:daunorubicin resistance ABC transporter ATP-binding subunit
MSDIIKVENLVKVYPGGTRAVDGISFSVSEGEFFGFLGPNGAGKSTTIQVLTTLLKKTSGSATVAGYDIDKDAREIRKVIGVQRQETILDGDLTGRENLTLQGHLQRLHGNALKKRVDELLTLVELSDVADKRAAHYSGGMKKRLDLASTLVHKPRVLFLDEPTSGLDPQSRAAIWEHLETLNQDEGVTIFLTTQQMEEADRLCQRLSIIDHGEIIVGGSPVELKHQLGGDTITLSLADGDSDGVRDRSKRIVSGIQGVTKVLDIETGLAAYAKNAGALVPDIVRLFDENGIRLTSINVASASLDDVFLQHTGRRIRSEELSKGDTWKGHV